VTDALGNAHAENGARGARHDYLPFGEELSAGAGGRTAVQGYSPADGVRQMTRRATIEECGDTPFLPGEIVERGDLSVANAAVVAAGGRAATARDTLLGITRAALATTSFLSAASFQETTRVLAEAALRRQVDRLQGLKENVIVGRRIPAGTGFRRSSPARTLPPGQRPAGSRRAAAVAAD